MCQFGGVGVGVGDGGVMIIVFLQIKLSYAQRKACRILLVNPYEGLP